MVVMVNDHNGPKVAAVTADIVVMVVVRDDDRNVLGLDQTRAAVICLRIGQL